MDASPVSRAVTRLQRWSLARGWSQVRMFVAPSELARPRYVSAFACDPARVHVLGSPRFDVIRGGPAFERVAAGDVRRQLGVAPDEHLVAWLPTWRERGDAAWLPALEGRLLDETLAGTSVVVVAKPHPYSDLDVYRERLPEHPRFRLLPEAKVDVNCLMHVADQLVTDYSSVSFDYSILQRPIHFLAPDIAEYGRGRDFYEPFDAITQGREHDAWEPLLRSIARAAGGERSDALANTEWIAEHTGNRAEPGASDRIVDAVAGRLGPRRQTA
jgi:CDP-glycerol glycerophosphotransferase (TagB/SpsB family)